VPEERLAQLRALETDWRRNYTQAAPAELVEGTEVELETEAAHQHEILTVEEAAEYLRISRKHLGNILAGKVKGAPPLDCVHAGRRTLIRRAALDQWFAEGRVDAV
jgi:excisionase family DNA binding protein